MNEIPYSNLPKTILDAFEVTRNLGLEYIWIDSLCIVQDDQPDKDRELPRMRRIYANSFVTISAASATSCYEGFLDPRPNDRSPRHLSVRVDGARLGSVLVFNRRETMEFTDRRSQPINDRAWTLQEGWVAARLLVFAGMSVFWKCGQEGWQSWRPWYSTDEDGDSDSDSWTDSSADTNPEKDHTEHAWDRCSGYVVRKGFFHQARQTWESIVENYTGRDLTVEGDKLPAISAIAETFAPFLGGGSSYVAGLWRPHLVRDLLWYTAGREPRLTGHGPTWSWASNAGLIKFAHNHDLDWNIAASASVLDCSVVLASEGATYGAVESGEVVIEGFVAELGQLAGLLRLVWDDGRGREGGVQAGMLDCSSNGMMNGSEHPLSPGPVSYWTLTIATNDLDVPDGPETYRGARAVLGLVLTEQGVGEGMFRRVGYFELRPEDEELGEPSLCWQGEGRKVVKIV
jgi:hypothetical protein